MTYMYPFPRGTKKSQVFGENPNNGYNPGGGHTGDDWIVPVGTPIRAAASGVIRNSGWLSDNYQDNGWWLTRMGGDTLVLDATDAFGRSDRLPTFVYAHCSDSTAEVGQYVNKGDIIGYSGNSGTATSGPHCHVEALPPSWDFNNGTYGRVDPEIYFDEYWDMTVSAQGDINIISIPEDDDMSFTDQDRAVINSANIRAGNALSEATNSKLASQANLELTKQLIENQNKLIQQGSISGVQVINADEVLDKLAERLKS